MAAPLMVKMLCSGTSAAATTAPVVMRWVPTTVTWRTWNPGRVSASARRPTWTVSAAAAITRLLQEVCRMEAGGGGGDIPRRACRRLRGDEVSFDPGLRTNLRTGRDESAMSAAWARTRATWRERSSSTSVLTRRARCGGDVAHTQAETCAETLAEKTGPHGAG